MHAIDLEHRIHRIHPEELRIRTAMIENPANE